ISEHRRSPSPAFSIAPHKGSLSKATKLPLRHSSSLQQNTRERMQESIKQDGASQGGEVPYGQDEQFAIGAAASLQDVRPLVLKHGDGFGVFDSKGDVRPAPGGALGVYYRDTRHLSHFALLIERKPPLLLSSSLRDDNATLTCDLTNPDLFDREGRVDLAHDLIHLRRSRFLWKSSCFERIYVRNFDERRRRIEIAVEFA